MFMTANERLTTSSLSESLSRFLSSSSSLSARVLSSAVVVAVSSVSGNAGASLMPSNPEVMCGGASFIYSDIQNHNNSTNLDIISHTDKTIINWGSFDTTEGHTVRFIEPNNNSIVLNRDMSGHMTYFDGNLQSNGKVWIINPNGMLFDKHANVQVGGLLLSTANITDDKMGGDCCECPTGACKDRYEFDQAAPNQANAVITINGAHIETVVGGTDRKLFDPSSAPGDVIIQAPAVALTPTDFANPRGKGVRIKTNGGSFIMASGQTFTVDFNGDGLVNYSTYYVDTPVTQKVTGAPTDFIWSKDDAQVPVGTEGGAEAGKSNIMVGADTIIDTTSAGSFGEAKALVNTGSSGHVKFVAKVDPEAVMDHVINLGGEFSNFENYLSSDGSRTYEEDLENARITNFETASVEINSQAPKPTCPATSEPTSPPETNEPTNPPETSEPTSPPDDEPTNPPTSAPTPAPTTAPAPSIAPQTFERRIDPLSRPLTSAGDETIKDTTVDPKHNNVTYERPYLVNLNTSIADGKLTLLSGGNGGSPTNLGNLTPAAGGNSGDGSEFNDLAPAAGGSGAKVGNGISCANSFLDKEWNKNPNELCPVEKGGSGANLGVIAPAAGAALKSNPNLGALSPAAGSTTVASNEENCSDAQPLKRHRTVAKSTKEDAAKVVASAKPGAKKVAYRKHGKAAAPCVKPQNL